MSVNCSYGSVQNWETCMSTKTVIIINIINHTWGTSVIKCTIYR